MGDDPVELPERRELREHRAAVQEWLAGLSRERAGEELAWVGLPTLAAGFQNRGRQRFAPRPIESERRQALLQRPHLAAVTGEWLRAGRHLLLAQTENHRRALEPIARRLGIEALAPPEPSPLASERVERALAFADEIIASAAAASLDLPDEPIVVYRTMVRAARAIAAADAALAAAEPGCVVIGGTHANAPRALARAARSGGVPSAYVPHAPLIANLLLADLPVDLALVRGSRELEAYVAAGADETGVRVIGNPASAALPDPPALDASGPVAFALPTDDERALALMVGVVHEGLGGEVVASPHPRADRDRLADLLPDTWRLWDRPTADLLLSGPPALVQASSGTGLEALALGIPLIDLRFPGESPNYPYLEDPRIAAPGTAGDLREAVDAARALAAGEREALRSLAGEWVSATDGEAASAGVQALERLAGQGPRAVPVWDAWGLGS